MWDTFTCRIILNGIIVKIGCQRIYFPTAYALGEALDAYIKDPQESIKRWRDTPFQKISEGCVLTADSSVEVAPSSPPPPPDTGDSTSPHRVVMEPIRGVSAAIRGY